MARQIKLKDLRPDSRNANKHSEKGMEMLKDGIIKNGLGRSILLSADDEIIAGNGVAETAQKIGIQNVKVIETDGTEIIAVKRTDIKSGTKEFYEMALSDNIIAKENIIMDAEVVDAICEDFEIEEYRPKFQTDEDFGAEFTLPDGDKSPFQQITFTLANEQAEQIKKALADIKESREYKNLELVGGIMGNENSNGNALYLIVLQWSTQITNN